MTRPGTGAAIMVAAMAIFAAQDGISRHLAEQYNVLIVVMIRYWFFAAFVLALALRSGGVRATARTSQPWVQVSRGVLLVAEICVMVLAFTVLGLVNSLAVFACYPLLVAALSGPMLGEWVGPRRWAAIFLGFVGVLVILAPGLGVFSWGALIPLCCAAMFAAYTLLTRYAARRDTAMTSFFWTGAAGAVAISLVGVWWWEPMRPPDWAWMATLCLTGALGHWLLIRAYELAEAPAIQPLAYLHLAFGAGIGVLVFGETLRTHVALGAGIVVAAGLYTLWRDRASAQALRRTGAGPVR